MRIGHSCSYLTLCFSLSLSLSLSLSGEVTPELEELMRKVWQPLIEPDQEIIVGLSYYLSERLFLSDTTDSLRVCNFTTLYGELTDSHRQTDPGGLGFSAFILIAIAKLEFVVFLTLPLLQVLHIKKPKSAVSLGISIEGVDEVRKPEFRPLAPTAPVLPNGGSIERKSIEPRHFVQAVVPNGLIGSLNIVRPGDELLQVNGRRLRGTSSTNTVRCLRSLPQYIELVLARSKSGAPVPTIPGVDASWAFVDEPPFELQASEVNSVDTTYSASPIAEVTAPYPIPVSPKTAHSRVSEWVRRSVTEQPDGSISTDADVNRTHSPEVQSSYAYPANILPYPTDKNATPLETRNSVTRGGRDGLFESSGATLPRSYPAYLQDPRYGSKRPVWSTVPLLVQLNKSSNGFGFSLSEYEELTVSDPDSHSRRKSLTLGRRKSSRLSPNSRGQLTRSSTLPRSWNRPVSDRKSASSKHGFLLIDSIVPNGVAHLDGRISMGDRLLFVNDRNLAKASLREAAAALRAAPTGPCLLGIAKMHLESNVTTTNTNPLLGSSPSAFQSQNPLNGGYEPLYIDTDGPLANGGHMPVLIGPLVQDRVGLQWARFEAGSFSALPFTSMNRDFLSTPTVRRSQSFVQLHRITAVSTTRTLLSSPDSLVENVQVRPHSPTPNRMETIPPKSDSSSTVSQISSCLSSLVACLVSDAIYAAVACLAGGELPRHSSALCSPELSYTRSCSSSQSVNHISFREVDWNKLAEPLVTSVLASALEQIEHELYSSIRSEIPEEENETQQLVEAQSLSCERELISHSVFDDEIATFSSIVNADLETSVSEGISDAEEEGEEDIDLSTTSTVSLSGYLQSKLTSSTTASSSPRPTSPRSMHSCSCPKSGSADDRSSSNSFRGLNNLPPHRDIQIYRPKGKRVSKSSSMESLNSCSYLTDGLEVPHCLETDAELTNSNSKIPDSVDNMKYHHLNFHVLPGVDSQPELHAHDLSFPPVGKHAEKSVRIPLLSDPIGIKLDALAAGGQDGCRVLQVLEGGAVYRTNLLKPNDYVTEQNGQSMRGITNLEAFQLLKQASTPDGVIDFVYLPAEVVQAHRLQCLRFAQSTMPNGDLLQPVGAGESRIEPNRWQVNSEKVVLHRSAYETAWGLVLDGDDTSHIPASSLDFGLSNPTVIRNITPGTPADRCEALQPDRMHFVVRWNADCSRLLTGPLLLFVGLVCEVGDVDVTNLGPAKTGDLLRDLLSRNIRDLELHVRFSTAAQPYVSSFTEQNGEKRLVVVDVERRASVCDPLRSNDQGKPLPPSIGFHHVSKIGPNEDSSPDSSQMEIPEPLVDSGEETIPLASLAGPVLNEDLTGTRMAGRVESPPIRPPRRFSKQLSPTSDLIENLPVITSDPVSLYTRTAPPGDTILRLVIELPWPVSVEMHNRLDNLGIHLVGSRLPEYSGTYVAGFSPGSIAEQHGDLRVGDEIVQVNQIGVAGSGRLLVGRCISNAIQQSYEHVAKDHEREDIGQLTNPTISLVIRRNPVHLELLSALSSPERISMPSAFDDSAIPSVVSSTLPKQTTFGKETYDTPSGPRDQYDSSDARSTEMSLLDQIASLLNEPLDNFEIFDVNIHRDKDGFGIFLVNYGPDDRPGVFVSELAPNGAASLQCKLYPHDQILAVNGSVEKDYDATFRRMKMSASQVRLTIGRRKQSSSTGPTTQPVATSSPNPLHTSDDSPVLPALPTPVEIVPGQETLIELTRKPGNSWGFSIVGGVNTSLTTILIHSIHDDGVVASDGRLAVGDRLLAVNGIDLRNVDHETATNAIRSGGDSLKLLVYREPPARFEDLTEPLELAVTIPRQAGQNLGLALIGRSPYSTGTAISSVAADSPAEQCGLLRPGDVILDINGLDVRLAQTQEVVSILRSSVGPVKLKVERQPASARPPYPPSQPRLPLEVETVFLQRSGELRNNSSNRRPSQPLLGWSNAEASFGLFLRQASKDELLDAGGYLIVESVLENSPAAISLKIHPGDRLLAVDREPVDWLLPDEVFELLAGLSECTLELGHLPRAPYPNTPDFVVGTPYPPVFENHQLPDVFGAEMPPIVQPAGVREMGTLEEEDDHGPVVDVKQDHGLPEHHEEEEEEEEGEINSETTSVSSAAVRDAMTKAKRAAHGFQVRQVYLPPYVPGSSLGLRLVRSTGISGTIVVDVASGSAAALANLCVGDRVLGLDNKLLLALGPGISASKIVANIEQTWRTRKSGNLVSLTVISTSQPENEVNGISLNHDRTEEDHHDELDGTGAENHHNQTSDRLRCSQGEIGHQSTSAGSQDFNEHRLYTTAGTTPEVDAQTTFPTLQGRVVYGPEDEVDS
ncbi:hypothetical protein P879_04939 [Paragonimus westermani]|uniref:PDZ domain-containing protein n=1 Tax=Paragonimus westermani TaxID=34504 RepID=A0A8T0D3K9_9TREM|nr:hypothetical protein P879_04939 [Paragonimus westermani]